VVDEAAQADPVGAGGVAGSARIGTGVHRSRYTYIALFSRFIPVGVWELHDFLES